MKISYDTSVFLILMVVGVVCGCTRNAPGTTEEEFFGGKFRIDAEDGLPVFTDCATYITMRISGGRQYEDFRREYEEEEIEAGQEVLLDFIGRFERAGSGNDDSGGIYGPEVYLLPTVRIDSVLNIDRYGECLTDFILPGIYRSDPDPKESSYLLRLRPDYTYTLSHYAANGPETETQGVWYRKSRLIIALKSNSDDTEQQFQVMPTQESLAPSGDNPLPPVRKVYI